MESNSKNFVSRVLETMIVDGVEWVHKQACLQEESYCEPIVLDVPTEWSAMLPSGAHAYAIEDNIRGFEVGLSVEIEEVIDSTTAISTFEFGISRFEVPKELFTRTALELEKIRDRAIAGLRAAL